MREWLAPVLAALSALGAAWLAYRQALGAKKIDTTASPYDSLAARVVSLESSDSAKGKELATMRHQLDAVIDDRDGLVRYIVVLREWVVLGAKPPAPNVPAYLRDVLPAWEPPNS